MNPNLSKDFKAIPDNKDIETLLRLKDLLVCCISMKYDLNYPEVIEMLTGVRIRNEDIKKLYLELLIKYKHEDNRIHSYMKKIKNLSTFFGKLEE
jgi:hypothetical protein